MSWRLAFSLGLQLSGRASPRGLLHASPRVCVSGWVRSGAVVMDVRRRALATERTLVPGAPADFPELRGDLRTRRENVEGPVVDSDGKVFLKSMTLAEMIVWVEETLGHKRYRALGLALQGRSVGVFLRGDD
jgi:hypothetical protein